MAAAVASWLLLRHLLSPQRVIRHKLHRHRNKAFLLLGLGDDWVIAIILATHPCRSELKSDFTNKVIPCYEVLVIKLHQCSVLVNNIERKGFLRIDEEGAEVNLVAPEVQGQGKN